MSSKGRLKPSLHRLSRELLSEKDMDEFYREILGTSDRVTALLCGAMLDNALMKIIATKMIKLSETEIADVFVDRNAVLGTFASKISIAHALGLITKDQKNVLDRIRKIRNTFAHALKPISFEQSLISAECHKLPPHKYIGANSQTFSQQRLRYMSATLQMFSEFNAQAHAHIKKRQIVDALMKKPVS